MGYAGKRFPYRLCVADDADERVMEGIAQDGEAVGEDEERDAGNCTKEGGEPTPYRTPDGGACALHGCGVDLLHDTCRKTVVGNLLLANLTEKLLNELLVIFIYLLFHNFIF